MPFEIVIRRADKLTQFGIKLHHMPVGVDDSVISHSFLLRWSAREAGT